MGRGLGSLISMDDTPARGTSAINDIELSQISPNPEQPRTTFDEEALDELASSIRELGIIQPLSLRKQVLTAIRLLPVSDATVQHSVRGLLRFRHIYALPTRRN